MDMNYRGGMWEGGGVQDEVEWGGEWDNCNSIINKIYFKKEKKGNPSTLLVGMQSGAATVENSMEFPQKTKDGTAFQSRDPIAGIIP